MHTGTWNVLIFVPIQSLFGLRSERNLSVVIIPFRNGLIQLFFRVPLSERIPWTHDFIHFWTILLFCSEYPVVGYQPNGYKLCSYLCKLHWNTVYGRVDRVNTVHYRLSVRGILYSLLLIRSCLFCYRKWTLTATVWYRSTSSWKRARTTKTSRAPWSLCNGRFSVQA